MTIKKVDKSESTVGDFCDIQYIIYYIYKIKNNFIFYKSCGFIKCERKKLPSVVLFQACVLKLVSTLKLNYFF